MLRSMLRVLLLLMLLLPFAELSLLIFLGRQVGLWQTIGLMLATSFLGVALAKHQGVRVIGEWQRAQAEGRVPEEGLVSALLVLVGSGLLLMPGFISDVLGLALLLPPTRRVIAALIRTAVTRGINNGRIHVVTQDGFVPPTGPIIDVNPPALPPRHD